MNILRFFSSKFKLIFSIFFLLFCLSTSLKAEVRAIESGTCESKDLPCEMYFWEAYQVLCTLEKNGLLDNTGQLMRQQMLDIVFHVLYFMEGRKHDMLYSIFLHIIVRIFYGEGPEKMDKNSLIWRDFIRFLEFYEIGSVRYHSLYDKEELIDTFHLMAGPFANLKCKLDEPFIEDVCPITIDPELIACENLTRIFIKAYDLLAKIEISFFLDGEVSSEKKETLENIFFTFKIWNEDKDDYIYSPLLFRMAPLIFKKNIVPIRIYSDDWLDYIDFLSKWMVDSERYQELPEAVQPVVKRLHNRYDPFIDKKIR